MAHLINKDRIVAEIEKNKKQYAKERNTITKNNDNCHVLLGRIKMCDDILSFIDSLEVKEVEEKFERPNIKIKDAIQGPEATDGDMLTNNMKH